MGGRHRPASPAMKGLICQTRAVPGQSRASHFPEDQPETETNQKAKEAMMMKKLSLAAAILAATATTALAAGDYVDSNGCTHIDMGGYYNLGLEPGCGRTAKEGGWWIDAKRAGDDEEDTDK